MNYTAHTSVAGNKCWIKLQVRPHPRFLTSIWPLKCVMQTKQNYLGQVSQEETLHEHEAELLI